MPAIAATLVQKSVPIRLPNITQGSEMRKMLLGYLRQRFWRFFFWAILLANGNLLWAGGGPENLMLVVNSNSQASLEVANHYARLYNLPVTNVIHLDYKGDVAEISGTQFRQEILLPILKAIDDRGLSAQIDIIAYSCDFPWRVKLEDLFSKEQKFSKQQKPWASLNGATYLWQSIVKPSAAVVSLNSNWYIPGPNHQNTARCRNLNSVTSRGFRGRYFWMPDGSLSSKPGQGRRYFLSTMLGVVSGRGNSVEEVIASLRRSAYANADTPQGTFFFMRRKEVRSTTRHDCFASVAKQINELGASAKIEDGVFPAAKDPILGLMIGRSDLPLDRKKPNIQPGAICEHLTSYGGMMHDKNWQTPLTDLIRAGASGASGTVDEPYAIQAKFPMPSLHLHYRRGCNLAEAFYQSVASPYQLLIVGDPLCQPWANRPVMKVPGWTPGGELKVISKLTPDASKIEQKIDADDKPDPDSSIKQFLVIEPQANQLSNPKKVVSEFYLDGKLRILMNNGNKALIKIDSIPNGWHEARCVVGNNDSIESRAALTGWFLKRSPDTKELNTTPVQLNLKNPNCRLGEKIEVEVLAKGAKEVVVKNFSREVARHKGDDGQIFIDSKVLGRGPVQLQAFVDSTGASSAPAWITVQ